MDMIIINIDFVNKQFETEDGEIYPFIFEVDSSITLNEFQQLIDESGEVLKKLLNN